MGLNRKIIVTALVGFLLGAMLGIGALQLSKRGVAVPFLPTPLPYSGPRAEALTATCFGGTNPRVMLLWQGGSPRAVSIDRDDGSGWISLGLTEADNQTHIDLTVAKNMQYRYRLSADNLPVSSEAQISTGISQCGQ